MKHIYFVRHGESEENKHNIRQGDDSVLSKEGVRQAKIVAKRFTKISIDTIIASPFPRAKQTAEIIQKNIRKAITHSDLFKERKKPSEVIGLKMDDPTSLRVTHHMHKNFHKPNWRHSDEENFVDLKKRAGKALIFLEQQKEENILVVTHSLFMSIFLARMMFGRSLTSREYVKTVYSHSVKNTGITLYEYDSTKKRSETQGWLLKVWNDHAHLG